MRWQEWKPELAPNDTLKTVLAKMPRVSPDKIPWQIRLIENPDSFLSFPGAINLFRHDCLHAIMCASFHPLDEAFVIGFTMGSDPRMTRKFARIFMWLTTWFYPKNYRLDKHDLIQFMRGYILSRKLGVRNLSKFPFEKFQDCSLDFLRKILGIRWLRDENAYNKWSKSWSPDQFE